MDFETKWAIQQAHKTLLDFGHLLDEQGPSPQNEARLRYNIPRLAAQAMRTARGLETALQAIEAEDATASCAQPPLISFGDTNDLKDHMSSEVEGLRAWIRARDIRTINAEPEPDRRPSRQWPTTFLISLILATLMTIFAVDFLRNRDDETPGQDRMGRREMEYLPQPSPRANPSGAPDQVQ